MAKKKIKIERELVLEAALFALAVTAVSTLYRNNILLTSVMVAGWMVAIKFWHRKEDIHLFLIAAIAGAFAEVIAIKFGAWKYANPTVLGVPIWLPLLWGSAVIFIKRVAETFTRLVK